MNTRIAMRVLALAGVLLATDATAGKRADDRALAKHGVVCHEQSDTTDDGETHWCVFSPREFGRRDFSGPNGRAGYVVTELGPRCEEIEILADEEHTVDGDAQPNHRRVSVSCTR